MHPILLGEKYVQLIWLAVVEWSLDKSALEAGVQVVGSMFGGW